MNVIFMALPEHGGLYQKRVPLEECRNRLAMSLRWYRRRGYEATKGRDGIYCIYKPGAETPHEVLGMVQL